MKKIIYIIFTIIIFNFSNVFAQNGPPACDDYVSIQGRTFYCGGQPFYPLVCGYIPQIIHYEMPGDINITYSSYFISRSGNYGLDPSSYENNSYPLDQTVLGNDIKKDFTVIHKMGFNTVRIAFAPDFGLSPCSDWGWVEWCQDPTKFQMRTFCMNTWGGKWMVISTDPAYDPYRDRLFSFYRDILEYAHDCSLKVLFDVGWGNFTID
jgi:hypothetical protein